MKPILIVEDEPEVAGILRDYLRAEGFRTANLARGDQVAGWLQSNDASLMLLDHMLPGLTGLEVCKQVRRHSSLPIIMVTARVDEIDRLLGLELGADDYICKPFSPREVVARVKTVLRRVSGAIEPNVGPRLQMDDERFLVRCGDGAVELTVIEHLLLRQLVSRPGRLLSRTQLIEGMYHDGRNVTERTVDSHIRKIRRKLATITADYEPIQSVYGAGYRYEASI